MQSVVRRTVYTSVIDGEDAGAITIHREADKWPLQIKLSEDDLRELKLMIDETLQELQRRREAGKR